MATELLTIGILRDSLQLSDFDIAAVPRTTPPPNPTVFLKQSKAKRRRPDRAQRVPAVALHSCWTVLTEVTA